MAPLLQLTSAGEKDGHGLMEHSILILPGTTGYLMILILMMSVGL